MSGIYYYYADVSHIAPFKWENISRVGSHLFGQIAHYFTLVVSDLNAVCSNSLICNFNKNQVYVK